MKSRLAVVAAAIGTALVLPLAASAQRENGPQAAEPAGRLFRCPGPPVLYTDAITAGQARINGCRPLHSRWLEIGVDSEGTLTMVDTQTLRRRGVLVDGWLLKSYGEPQRTKGTPSREFLSAKSLVAFNCDDRTQGLKAALLYERAEASGDIVGSFRWAEHETDHRYVVPESLGEKLLNYVCLVADR